MKFMHPSTLCEQTFSAVDISFLSMSIPRRKTFMKMSALKIVLGFFPESKTSGMESIILSESLRSFFASSDDIFSRDTNCDSSAECLFSSFVSFMYCESLKFSLIDLMPKLSSLMSMQHVVEKRRISRSELLILHEKYMAAAYVAFFFRPDSRTFWRCNLEISSAVSKIMFGRLIFNAKQICVKTSFMSRLSRSSFVINDA